MRPIVFVQVSGGVAYTYSAGDVDIVELDWDNLRVSSPEESNSEIRAALKTIRPYAAAGDNQRTFSNLVDELESAIQEEE